MWKRPRDAAARKGKYGDYRRVEQQSEVKVHPSSVLTWCNCFTTHADGLGPGGSLTPAKFTATSLAVV